MQLAGQRLRLLEQVFGSHVRFDGVEHDADRFGELIEERFVGRAEPVETGQFHDGFHVAFEDDRKHDDVQRLGFAQAGGDLHVIARDVGEQNLFLFQGALADEAFAELEPVVDILAFLVGVAGEHLQVRLIGLRRAVHHVEDRLLGGDHGGQFRQNEAADREQIFLALQHSAEFGEVGLEPVLLRVFERGFAEVSDHFVDVVLEGGDFALGGDGDGTSQVALGDGGGHFGDGADLRRQIRGELVHVVGQVAPGSGCAGHGGLPAQFSFDAHFAGHGGHLIGERRKRVDHAVDRVGELGDFAFGFHGQLSLEIAVGDGGHHLGDVAHLVGEAFGHEVHVVGEFLPNAGDAFHFGLTAEFSFGAHFAGHAGYFGGEAVELVHHRVDGLFQFENFPAPRRR